MLTLTATATTTTHNGQVMITGSLAFKPNGSKLKCDATLSEIKIIFDKT